MQTSIVIPYCLEDK